MSPKPNGITSRAGSRLRPLEVTSVNKNMIEIYGNGEYHFFMVWVVKTTALLLGCSGLPTVTPSLFQIKKAPC